MKHRVKLIVYAVLTLAVMVIIFVFSAQNGDESGSLSNHFLLSLIGGWIDAIMKHITLFGQQLDVRKFAHMSEYFALGTFSSLFFHEFFQTKFRILKAAVASFALCFAYACSDEWHQTFVEGRYGCFRDVCIDGAGFTLAIVFFAILYIIFVNRKSSDNH